jgi:transcriptional regulator with XRE-family HTH domain
MSSSDPWRDAPWPRHGPTCICFACQRRRRKLARLALIEPRRLVYSDEARTHVEALVAAGMKKTEVAKRAGVSPALISKVLKPGSVINAKTAERILALG